MLNPTQEYIDDLEDGDIVWIVWKSDLRRSYQIKKEPNNQTFGVPTEEYRYTDPDRRDREIEASKIWLSPTNMIECTPIADTWYD
ncbi:hypothetical protein [Spirosoma terrae]|uniref:Uncharacterized protein n=1 Tax=Spirosoma terrae TaxID=1968276 RepID=A0A6L9L5V3_9BACT|nr:hypothetical protein [Spirosoma terrae]NDU95770.1 hypothetical protein [Spirosoma terrae]